jgi:hypothetical protein
MDLDRVRVRKRMHSMLHIANYYLDSLIFSGPLTSFFLSIASPPSPQQLHLFSSILEQ